MALRPGEMAVERKESLESTLGSQLSQTGFKLRYKVSFKQHQDSKADTSKLVENFSNIILFLKSHLGAGSQHVQSSLRQQK